MKTPIQAPTIVTTDLARRDRRISTTRSAHRAMRAGAVIAAAALLCACASSGPVAEGETAAVEQRVLLREIPDGETIRITGAAVGANALGTDATSAARRRTAGKVAAGTAGAVGGAVLGASGGLIAGIVACGPIGIICGPIAMVVGGVGGSAALGAMGAKAVGNDAPRRKAARHLPRVMRDAAVAAQVELSTSEPLVDAFAAQSVEHWAVDDAAAGAPAIAIRVEQFDFTRGSSKQLVLNLVSSMTVTYPSEPSGSTGPALFRFESAQHTAKAWAANGGALIDAEIERGLEQHAAAMVRRLSEPAPQLRSISVGSEAKD